MADKTKAAKAFENVTPLLGLVGSLAGQIPGLKKAKKRNTSQAAARNATMRSAGAAVGGSQTGFGASRGLALRTGLRRGAQTAREGAQAAAVGAAADEARYVGERDARNARLGQFGKDVAETGAAIGTGITESRAAGEAEAAAGQAAEMQAMQEQAATLLPTYAESQGIDPATGLQQQQEAPQQLNQPQNIPADAGQAQQQEGFGNELSEQAALNEPPGLEELALDPALAELGLQDKDTLYSIAPELEAQHRLENLALAEAYRTGANINRIYARLRRMQDLPAVASTIDISRALQFQGAE